MLYSRVPKARATSSNGFSGLPVSEEAAMSMATKPKGYASVSVYIVAQEAQRVIDFLKTTFDATQLR